MKTKPHRVRWLIYAILGGIAFFFQLTKGSHEPLWLSYIEMLSALFILLLLIKFCIGVFNINDYNTVFAVAIGLIAAGHFTNEAAIALYALLYLLMH